MSAGSRASFCPDGFMNLRSGVASLDFRRYRKQGRPMLTEPPTTLPCASASDLSDLEVKFTNSRADRFFLYPGASRVMSIGGGLDRDGAFPEINDRLTSTSHEFPTDHRILLLPGISFRSSKVRVSRGRLHPAEDCSILRHRSERPGGDSI